MLQLRSGFNTGLQIIMTGCGHSSSFACKSYVQELISDDHIGPRGSKTDVHWFFGTKPCALESRPGTVLVILVARSLLLKLHKYFQCLRSWHLTLCLWEEILHRLVYLVLNLSTYHEDINLNTVNNTVEQGRSTFGYVPPVFLANDQPLNSSNVHHTVAKSMGFAYWPLPRKMQGRPGQKIMIMS